MQEKAHLIGITGGIGSGKSLVCKIFSTLGIPVFEADLRAKLLMNNDLVLKEQIIGLLGPEAYSFSSLLQKDEYNRAWVASKVFNNPVLLQELNQLVHPRVRKDASDWIEAQHGIPYILYEAALMKAAGNGNSFRKVIVVNAPVELRIKRVKSRDNRPEEEILNIIKRQISEEERLGFADFVIKNDDKSPVIDQVLELHQKLLTL